MEREVILKAVNIKKYFIKKNFLGNKIDVIKAVDGVHLEVPEGKTVGIVGESGSGKTTLARILVGLYRPSEGRIYLKDREINFSIKRDISHLRSKVQIVFQNPFSSLDPRQRVINILRESLEYSKISSEEIICRIKDILRKVELPDSVLYKFPHQLSGGQAQRIALARTLLKSPQLLILDEPTSSLDATVEFKILNLLKRLKNEEKANYIFISHNLRLIKFISDYIYVMLEGSIIEKGYTLEVFNKPLHPYTRQLLKASNYALTSEKISLQEGVSQGCKFYSRCSYRHRKCQNLPFLREIEPSHFVACWYC